MQPYVTPKIGHRYRAMAFKTNILLFALTVIKGKKTHEIEKKALTKPSLSSRSGSNCTADDAPC